VVRIVRQRPSDGLPVNRPDRAVPR